MLGHVHRRHGHDDDHDDLAHDHGHQGHDDRRSVQDLAHREGTRCGWDRRIDGSTLAGHGQVVGVRVQLPLQRERRQARRGRGRDERADGIGKAGGTGQRRGHGQEDRAEDRSGRGRPDDDADSGGAVLRPRHLGGGVARQLRGAVGQTDEQHPQEQQREAGHEDRRRGDRATAQAEPVADAQADPPAPPRHEVGQQRRADGCPHDPRRHGGAHEDGVVEHAVRGDDANGRGHDRGSRAQGGTGHQDEARATACRVEVVVNDRVGCHGHRSWTGVSAGTPELTSGAGIGRRPSARCRTRPRR